jgi:hypothetical protein
VSGGRVQVAEYAYPPPPSTMIVRILPLVVVLVSLATGVLGVLPWPFPSKRFTANAFVDAGTLGLEDAGRIVAFGDFDGDQLSVATYPLIQSNAHNYFPV